MAPLFIAPPPLAIAYTLIDDDESIFIEESLALMMPVTLYINGTLELDGMIVEV